MSKSMSQKARAKLYRRRSFRNELADSLGLGGIRVHVSSCLDALLEARRLPSRSGINSRTVAMDAALILISIATMQTDARTAVQMSDRLSAMKLREMIDTSDDAEREVPISVTTDLADDLAAVFEDYWAAPEGAFLEGLCHVAFITHIATAPADDAATLLRISDRRRHSYSTATPATKPELIHRRTRGGMTLMPSAIANFAEQIRHDLGGTAADVRTSNAPIMAGDASPQSGADAEQIAMTRKDGKTIMS